ncbi:methyl-accepting chemotaxis protein [Xylophilus sp. GW821-FHT01B05]
MNTWTVKRRLTTLLIGVVAAFSALTLFLLNRQSSVTAELDSLYTQDYRVASLIGQIDGLLTRSDINILRMIAIGTPEAITGWKTENAARFTQADKLIETLRATADPDMAASVKTLSESYGRMRLGMEHQVAAIEQGDVQRGGEINKNEVKDNADKTFGSLAELKSTQDRLAQSKVESQQAAASTALWLSLLAAVVAVLGSALCGAWLVRSLLRQLGGEPTVAAQTVATLARGDLTASIPVRDNDEHSLIAQLRQMQQNLIKLVSGVRSNSESVATASTQIAQGNADLSQRTEQQASALQETAATMEELGSTVRHNADNAKQASQLAQGASNVAAKGGEVVARVVGTMKDINDSSRKIADIISVIDGIAFQTNILALNAAVEAARAGEQGRGFAVVASEVRSLAQRSADAAKQIKTLITSSVEQVDLGSVLVAQAGQTMEEIVGAIRRVTDIVTEISAASTEQSSGVSQVGEAITQMDQATQQNAALVEEGAAATASLRQQAELLVRSVEVFKLSQEHVRAAAPAKLHVPAPSVAARPRPVALARPATPKAKPPAPAPERELASQQAGADDDWTSF